MRCKGSEVSAEIWVNSFIVEWQNEIQHVGFTLEKSCFFFYSVSLLEMWFLVYAGLVLLSWMNEIPFAQNIMSVCVRTASRLVGSLPPVNKKTWTVLKLKNGDWTQK